MLARAPCRHGGGMDRAPRSAGRTMIGVIGTTGMVGAAVAERLHSAGLPVLLSARRRSAINHPTHADIEVAHVDITDSVSRRRRPRLHTSPTAPRPTEGSGRLCRALARRQRYDSVLARHPIRRAHPSPFLPRWRHRTLVRCRRCRLPPQRGSGNRPAARRLVQSSTPDRGSTPNPTNQSAVLPRQRIGISVSAS